LIPFHWVLMKLTQLFSVHTQIEFLQKTAKR
jgi:hypothetical protein